MWFEENINRYIFKTVIWGAHCYDLSTEQENILNIFFMENTQLQVHVSIVQGKVMKAKKIDSKVKGKNNLVKEF